MKRIYLKKRSIFNAFTLLKNCYIWMKINKWFCLWQRGKFLFLELLLKKNHYFFLFRIQKIKHLVTLLCYILLTKSSFTFPKLAFVFDLFWFNNKNMLKFFKKLYVFYRSLFNKYECFWQVLLFYVVYLVRFNNNRPNILNIWNE